MIQYPERPSIPNRPNSPEMATTPSLPSLPQLGTLGVQTNKLSTPQLPTLPSLGSSVTKQNSALLDFDDANTVNSIADVISKAFDPVENGDKFFSLATAIQSSKELFNNIWLTPYKQKNYLALGLNTLMSIGETLDALPNLVRAVIVPELTTQKNKANLSLKERLQMASGIGVKGRYNFDPDIKTGSKFGDIAANLVLDIVTDPIELAEIVASMGTSVAIKNSAEAITNAALTESKLITKNITPKFTDELVEASLDIYEHPRLLKNLLKGKFSNTTDFLKAKSNIINHIAEKKNISYTAAAVYTEGLIKVLDNADKAATLSSTIKTVDAWAKLSNVTHKIDDIYMRFATTPFSVPVWIYNNKKLTNQAKHVFLNSLLQNTYKGATNPLGAYDLSDLDEIYKNANKFKITMEMSNIKEIKDIDIVDTINTINIATALDNAQNVMTYIKDHPNDLSGFINYCNQTLSSKISKDKDIIDYFKNILKQKELQETLLKHPEIKDTLEQTIKVVANSKHIAKRQNIFALYKQVKDLANKYTDDFMAGFGKGYDKDILYPIFANAESLTKKGSGKNLATIRSLGYLFTSTRLHMLLYGRSTTNTSRKLLNLLREDLTDLAPLISLTKNALPEYKGLGRLTVELDKILNTVITGKTGSDTFLNIITGISETVSYSDAFIRNNKLILDTFDKLLDFYEKPFKKSEQNLLSYLMEKLAFEAYIADQNGAIMSDIIQIIDDKVSTKKVKNHLEKLLSKQLVSVDKKVLQSELNRVQKDLINYLEDTNLMPQFLEYLKAQSIDARKSTRYIDHVINFILETSKENTLDLGNTLLKKSGLSTKKHEGLSALNIYLKDLGLTSSIKTLDKYINQSNIEESINNLVDLYIKKRIPFVNYLDGLRIKNNGQLPINYLKKIPSKYKKFIMEPDQLRSELKNIFDSSVQMGSVEIINNSKEAISRILKDLYAFRTEYDMLENRLSNNLIQFNKGNEYVQIISNYVQTSENILNGQFTKDIENLNKNFLTSVFHDKLSIDANTKAFIQDTQDIIQNYINNINSTKKLYTALEEIFPDDVALQLAVKENLEKYYHMVGTDFQPRRINLRNKFKNELITYMGSNLQNKSESLEASVKILLDDKHQLHNKYIKQLREMCERNNLNFETILQKITTTEHADPTIDIIITELKVRTELPNLAKQLDAEAELGKSIWLYDFETTSGNIFNALPIQVGVYKWGEPNSRLLFQVKLDSGTISNHFPEEYLLKQRYGDKYSLSELRKKFMEDFTTKSNKANYVTYFDSSEELCVNLNKFLNDNNVDTLIGMNNERFDNTILDRFVPYSRLSSGEIQSIDVYIETLKQLGCHIPTEDQITKLFNAIIESYGTKHLLSMNPGDVYQSLKELSNEIARATDTEDLAYFQDAIRTCMDSYETNLGKFTDTRIFLNPFNTKLNANDIRRLGKELGLTDTEIKLALTNPSTTGKYALQKLKLYRNYKVLKDTYSKWFDFPKESSMSEFIEFWKTTFGFEPTSLKQVMNRLGIEDQHYKKLLTSDIDRFFNITDKVYYTKELFMDLQYNYKVISNTIDNVASNIQSIFDETGRHGFLNLEDLYKRCTTILQDTDLLKVFPWLNYINKDKILQNSSTAYAFWNRVNYLISKSNITLRHPNQIKISDKLDPLYNKLFQRITNYKDYKFIDMRYTDIDTRLLDAMHISQSIDTDIDKILNEINSIRGNWKNYIVKATSNDIYKAVSYYRNLDPKVREVWDSIFSNFQTGIRRADYTDFFANVKKDPKYLLQELAYRSPILRFNGWSDDEVYNKFLKEFLDNTKLYESYGIVMANAGGDIYVGLSSASKITYNETAKNCTYLFNNQNYTFTIEDYLKTKKAYKFTDESKTIPQEIIDAINRSTQQLQEYSNGLNIGSLGGSFTLENYKNILINSIYPNDQGLFLTVDSLNASGYFRTGSRLNSVYIGPQSMYYDNSYVNAFGINYLERIINANNYLIRTDINHILSIDLLFDQSNGMNFNPENSLFARWLKTDEDRLELIKRLQDSDELIVVVPTETNSPWWRTVKSGESYLSMQKVNLYTLEDLKFAQDNNAIIMPYQVFTGIFSDLTSGNKFNQSKLFRIYQTAMYLFKVSCLSNPGTWIRNLIDSPMKTMATTEDAVGTINSLFDGIKAYDNYTKILQRISEVNPNMGLTHTNFVKLWRDDPQFAKIMDLRQFEFLNEFISDESLSGASDIIYKTVYNKRNVQYLDTAEKDIIDNINTAISKLAGFTLSPMGGIERMARIGQYIQLEKLGYTRTQIFSSISKAQFNYAIKSDLIKYIELVIPFFNFQYLNFSFWMDRFRNNPSIIRMIDQALETSWDLMDYDYEEYAFNKSMQYHMLHGNITLDSDSGLTFKINPSYLDAFNTLVNPVDAIVNNVYSPIKNIISVAGIVGKTATGIYKTDEQAQADYNEFITSLKSVSNFPVVNAINNIIPWSKTGTTGKTNARLAGHPIEQTINTLLPGTFGAVKRWDEYKIDKNYDNNYTYRKYTYPKRSKNYYYNKQYLHINSAFYYEQSLKQQKLRLRSNIKAVVF